MLAKTANVVHAGGSGGYATPKSQATRVWKRCHIVFWGVHVAVAGSPVVGAALPVQASSLVPVLEQLTHVLTSLVQVLQAMYVPIGASSGSGQASAGAAQVQGGGDGGCSMGGASGAACGAQMQAAGGALGGPSEAAEFGYVQQPASIQASQLAASAGPLVSGSQRHSKKDNALVVADVARKLGVDPVLAVATMLVESNGDNTNNTGDDGTSFGLFQLHMGGHLPKDWYPGKPGHTNVFDPRNNAEIALQRFASNQGRFSGPELAYQSQRPANPAKYKAAVANRMAEARSLLGM